MSEPLSNEQKLPKLKDTACFDCDEKKLTRKGRAHYVCEGCGSDNSIVLVLLWEALLRKPKKKG